MLPVRGGCQLQCLFQDVKCGGGEQSDFPNLRGGKKYTSIHEMVGGAFQISKYEGE